MKKWKEIETKNVVVIKELIKSISQAALLHLNESICFTSSIPLR